MSPGDSIRGQRLRARRGSTQDDLEQHPSEKPRRTDERHRTPNVAAVRRHPVAWKPLLVVAGVLVVVLILTSRRYGYHADELFLLAAGHHLDWGYPDQGPVTPLIARVMSLLGDSLILLRLPAALMVGATTVLTGVIAARLGANVLAQVVAGLSVALSAFTLAMGHQLSTGSLSLLVWTAALLVILILAQGGDQRWWLWLGVIVGLGLENRSLILGLVAAIVIGLVAVGPRHMLGKPALWAAGVAFVIWLPYLLWQSFNDWPIFRAARGVSTGATATSTDRWMVLPMQFVLTGIMLAPIAIVGMVVLWKNPKLRFFVVAFAALAVAVIATGGKAFYLCGFYPVFFAAGAGPSLRWLIDRASRPLRVAIQLLVVVNVALTAVITLPLLPAKVFGSSGLVALNRDAGETMGWPEMVDTVAGVYKQVPNRANTAILTANYGEAGAIDRYGPEYELPRAYSAHMGYWRWGHPDKSVNTVVAVGFTKPQLLNFFSDCDEKATIHNGAEVKNREDGGKVFVCTMPLVSWPSLWPIMQQYS